MDLESRSLALDTWMTFRSETETLRARVEDLERENADLKKTIAFQSDPGTSFDPFRLFRRIVWFLLSSTEWTESREPDRLSSPPTAWGFFGGVYIAAICILVVLTGSPTWTVTIPAIAALITLSLLRTWIRYGMRLDDFDSKAKWEKRFE